MRSRVTERQAKKRSVEPRLTRQPQQAETERAVQDKKTREQREQSSGGGSSVPVMSDASGRNDLHRGHWPMSVISTSLYTLCPSECSIVPAAEYEGKSRADGEKKRNGKACKSYVARLLSRLVFSSLLSYRGRCRRRRLGERGRACERQQEIASCFHCCYWGR